jgi:hypothetical protein
MVLPKKKIFETVSFFVIVGFLSSWLYENRIGLFPSFIHAWTQSDRFALALGFLNNGFDFFHPQTFNLLTANGITQVDFPVHEYIVALLMKLSGVHEPIVFRLYILCYGLTGLYFLFRIVRLFGGTFLHGLFVSVFMMTCPVFTYYLDGFLPSIPSFANTMIGYYFFFLYKKQNTPRDFLLSIFFFTLAALARLPFVIFLFAISCQQFLGYIRHKKINSRELTLMISGFLVVLAYFFYNVHLAIKYGSQFLTVLLPAKSVADLKEIIFNVFDQWKFEYFSIAHYIVLPVILVYTLVLAIMKKKHPGFDDLLTQTWIILCGAVIYFFLMATQFPEHDYYFIDSFYPVVALFLVYTVPKIQFHDAFFKPLSVIACVVFIYLFCIQSNKAMNTRYTFNEWDRTEITRQNFTGSDRFLDSIGIPKAATMMVLDAYTTNTPLILMNRKGYTLLWTTKKNIDSVLQVKADYVVMQIVTQLEKIADNGSISIYRKQKNETRSLNEFLGIKADNIIYHCENDFEKDSACSSVDFSNRTIEKSFTGNYSMLIDSLHEFAPSISFLKKNIPFSKSTKILVKAKIYRQDPDKDLDLVASLSNYDQAYFYRNFSLNQYIGNAPGWNEILFQFVLPEIKNDDDKLTFYFWNKSKTNFYLDDFSFTVYR